MTKEVISISEALEVALHFGHPTNKWNPKMAQYIYGKKEGIHIIDLTKTVKKFQEAYDFVKKLAAEGKTFLLVGTKKQAQETILAEAKRADVFYVVDRWLGGTLTNFETLKKSTNRLKELEKMEESGKIDTLIKKEASKLKKEKAKLEKNFAGIKNMEKFPDCMFIVDTHREKIAVAEARKLGITIVGLIDTNCDPREVDYPIPANDDTIRAAKLITTRIVDAILKGRKAAIKQLKKDEKEAHLEVLAEGAEQKKIDAPAPTPTEEKQADAQQKASEKTKEVKKPASTKAADQGKGAK